MKIIKAASDLEQLRNTPFHDTVKEIISPYIDDPNYRPEDDGYLVLLERQDVDLVLYGLDMPWRLSEVPRPAPLTALGIPSHRGHRACRRRRRGSEIARKRHGFLFNVRYKDHPLMLAHKAGTYQVDTSVYDIHIRQINSISLPDACRL